MVKLTRSVPAIPEYYAGKSIFITGASGFMGKVLLERLLSTCPDIGTLYLLMRSKKDVLPEKRLLQLKQSQVFDVLRKTNPSQLEKLCIIPGDVSEPQLGMTMESLVMLQEVSIVFHSAATLKFDEALQIAVNQNVRSVMRLMDICDRLPKMEVFVHVSTGYSNAELPLVQERVYPPPARLAELLARVDAEPPHRLAQITAKYIAPKPNTYTFTKAMAETAVVEHCDRTYSVAIFRPTIVISSLRHPFPGWIENLNGPSGVIVGAGKGVLHVFRCRVAAHADMLPVDMAIDSLVAVAWETAIDKSPDVKVYNCSTNENPTDWLTFDRVLRIHLRQYPLDNAIWYPSAIPVHNKYAEKVLQTLLQTIPLYTAEYAMRLLGIKNKLSLITADRKLRAMSSVLEFFSLREWRFETTNLRRLRARLCESDAQTYNLDPNSIVWHDLLRDFTKGTRRYLLKEKDEGIEEARRHTRRLCYLHYGVITFGLLLLFRLVIRNELIYDIINGFIKLLLSLFHSAYAHIMS